ncbi:nebulette-like isoform X1 [Oncorhynchus masou masou]|uniref:nebulette-like isoform X1 n=1 Tax=Oncorhynchus masou masou TaxID=90313 RepID=UPI0031830E98
MDTQSVRNVSEQQSQVKRAADEVQEGSEEEGKVSLLCDAKDSGDPTCQAVSQLQSQAKYKEAGKQQFSTPLYSKLPETLETQHAKEASQLQSVVAYRSKIKHYIYNDVLGRFDIEHANVTSKLTSQVKSKTNQNQVIEASMDLPNLLHLEYALHATKLQSNAKYHEDFERTKGRGCTPVMEDQNMERMHHRNNLMMSEAAYKGVHHQVVEMDRRPGGIIVAPVLPGAYHQSAQPQQSGYGYMHQTSMSSVRSQQSPPSVTMRVYRALYDYVAQDHDEVSFRDGDVIVNAQPIDEGWMYGTVQRTGKSGMLPANYVECFN